MILKIVVMIDNDDIYHDMIFIAICRSKGHDDDDYNDDLRYAMLYTMICFAMLYKPILCYATLYCDILYIMLYYILCYATLHYAILNTILCYATVPDMPTSAMSVFTSCAYAAASLSNPKSANTMAKRSL